MFCACSNHTDADDLAQECYLRALRNWGRFEGRGSRQAWLFAIARSTQVDWFRRRGRQARILESSGDRRLPEPSLGPDIDEVEKIWNTVDGLGAEHREVVHLRFAANLSYLEIAETLGIPVGTVRSRLHRSLKIVRKQIEEQDNGT
jgi:RNA polymerase sigma-70 factor (ECF subfamily)